MKPLSFYFRFLMLMIAAAALVWSTSSCNQSEGRKFGTLQKVSHKTFPCEYYTIQVAYEGGVVKSSENGSAHSNTEDIAINRAAYDTLQDYLGRKVIFEYKDRGLEFCEPSKILTYFKIPYPAEQ